MPEVLKAFLEALKGDEFDAVEAFLDGTDCEEIVEEMLDTLHSIQ